MSDANERNERKETAQQDQNWQESGQVDAERAQDETRTVTEEFRISGEAVIAKVKELVREGNVRRITVKNDEGRTLIEIPLTIGVIGTMLLPVWAALGAIAALVANLNITVERRAPVGEASPAGEDLSRDDNNPLA